MLNSYHTQGRARVIETAGWRTESTRKQRSGLDPSPLAARLARPVDRGTFSPAVLGDVAQLETHRNVLTAACGSPAFGHYKPSGDGRVTAWALVVLELEGDRIVDWSSFLDVEALFPRFGLPLDFSARARAEPGR
jgi:hypothetical protein